MSACRMQEMDLAAAAAGVTSEPDVPPGVDGVIETVVGADGAAAGAPIEELTEEEILANQRLQPGSLETVNSTMNRDIDDFADRHLDPVVGRSTKAECS